MSRASCGLVIIHSNNFKRKLIFAHTIWILIEITINGKDIFIFHVHMNSNNNAVFNDFDIFLINFLIQNKLPPNFIIKLFI